jgi:hypothetical protein
MTPTPPRLPNACRHDWLDRFKTDRDYATMRVIADLSDHLDAIHSAVMAAHQAVARVPLDPEIGDLLNRAVADLERAWNLSATAHQRAEDALDAFRYPDQVGPDPNPEPDPDRLRDERWDLAAIRRAEREGLL